MRIANKQFGWKHPEEWLFAVARPTQLIVSLSQFKLLIINGSSSHIYGLYLPFKEQMINVGT